MGGYAHPEALVSTEWVAAHAHQPDVAVIEVDVDTDAYARGHVPGAIGWSWKTQLCDPVYRDITPKAEFEALMGQSGIGRDTTVVLYGDNNNWFAAWALWQMKIYGHPDVRLMNGGRKKWEEEGRELVTEIPAIQPVTYAADDPDTSVRSFLQDVKRAVSDGNADLVDVRSRQEYTGELLSPPGVQDTSQRAGHIPGAINVTWAQACNEDGTFKSRDELEKLYADAGITGGKPVITYCRIGERSSHSWFVLRYLLGFEDVTNYDGSWTEWGNLVGMPIGKSLKRRPSLAG